MADDYNYVRSNLFETQEFNVFEDFKQYCYNLKIQNGVSKMAEQYSETGPFKIGTS